MSVPPTQRAHPVLHTLEQIAAPQRQLHERLDGVEREMAAHATTPVAASVPPAPTEARGGVMTALSGAD